MVIPLLWLLDRVSLAVPDGSSGLSDRSCRVQQLQGLQWQDITGHALHQEDGDGGRHVLCKADAQYLLH